MDFPYLEDLAFWINSRYAIRKKRAEGEPPPWTNDPILLKYRFCNVHREDDRVTKWLHDNWLLYHGQHVDVWHRILLARMLNWPPTLNHIGYPEFWDPEHLVAQLQAWRDAGNKTFTTAYIVSTNGVKGDKIEYVIRVLNDMLETKRHPVAPTLSDTHANLVQFNAVGSFMAAQVVADLKHTDWLAQAPDWWDWAAPGPGSMRGLNRLLGLGVGERKWRNPEFTEVLSELRNQLEPEIEWVPDLCLQNLQNCLCEFDKYMRIKKGGQVRSKYRPHDYAM